MQPRIETLTPRKLVGKSLHTTFADNQTTKLWQSFMPKRKEVQHTVSTDLFSVQVYPQDFHFTAPNLTAPFQKWAAVEVSRFDGVPKELETLDLPGGLYAVFHYKGLSTDNSIFKYIFGEWLPASKDYALDNRPHFEILGSKYRNNDPESEEEIWIPIKPK